LRIKRVLEIYLQMRGFGCFSPPTWSSCSTRPVAWWATQGRTTRWLFFVSGYDLEGLTGTSFLFGIAVSVVVSLALWPRWHDPSD